MDDNRPESTARRVRAHEVKGPGSIDRTNPGYYPKSKMFIEGLGRCVPSENHPGTGVYRCFGACQFLNAPALSRVKKLAWFRVRGN